MVETEPEGLSEISYEVRLTATSELIFKAEHPRAAPRLPPPRQEATTRRGGGSPYVLLRRAGHKATDGSAEEGAMAQRVVHVKRDSFDVYIGRGRGSKWGNPYRIGDEHPENKRPIRRGEALELYREWILRGEGRPLLALLGELESKTLGCWCAERGGVGEHDPMVCHGAPRN